jgi:hypothetical protein
MLTHFQSGRRLRRCPLPLVNRADGMERSKRTKCDNVSPSHSLQFVQIAIEEQTLIVSSGANYYFGGMLLIIAGLLEFFLGNTFPSVVFLGISSSSSDRNHCLS